MNNIYDVLVIGAGIHGAGVLQAATAEGYKCLLLEKAASPGQGTSSRSSKLIHGGLRYLEHLEFGLVRECLRERELLLQLAPELVKLCPFYIPLYKNSSRGALTLRTGLSVYALFSGLHKHSFFSTIPRSKWSSMDNLTLDNLEHIFKYYDAQTDDKALTASVIQSAESLGAETQYNSQVKNIILDDLCHILTEEAGSQKEYLARIVVNAAGPWANQLLDCVSPASDKLPVDLVAGSHLVINKTLSSGAFYVESPTDNRAVFLIPWKGKTLVGTTEVLFDKDPDTVSPTAQEISYLMETARHYFSLSEKEGEILDSFSGLRVLPRAGSSGERFSSRPRETVLYQGVQQNSRLLSIFGGKLTAYRSTAEKVMHKLTPFLPTDRQKIADTKTLKLIPI